MQFTLIDRIVGLQAGEEITALKNLTLSEEYLQDHFPRFPVMPGVLMLEALYQASAWLLRVTDDFSHALILLEEARNVRYSDFVQPGQTLRIRSRLTRRDGDAAQFQAEGTVEDATAVRARLLLHRYHLSQQPAMAGAPEENIRRTLRHRYEALYRPDADAPSNDKEASSTPSDA